MSKKVKPKKHICRHCGKLLNSFYMAEICFELDMKILMNEKNGKENLLPARGRKNN